MVLISSEGGTVESNLEIIMHKLLLITVCVILPSFALSVAGKYLNGK